MNLELRSDEAHGAYLNFWDSFGGQDRVFRLAANGDVDELSYPDSPEDETEIWTRVDLVQELLGMALSDARRT